MADDEVFFSTVVQGGPKKRVYVDLKENATGKYLKLKEQGREGAVIIIPASAIAALRDALDEAAACLDSNSELSSDPPPVRKSTKKAPAAKAPKVEKPEPAPVDGKSLHVRNLLFTTTDQQLADHFAACGDVENALIHTTRGKSAGWAIVRFVAAEDATKALETLQGSDIDGRPVIVSHDTGAGTPAAPARKSRVKKAAAGDKPKAARDKELGDPVANTVFIANLSWGTTSEEVEAHFASAGAVVQAKLQLRKDGKSLGNATVEFENQADADAAIAVLEGSELDGRDLRVRQSYASFN
ncbi:hypothetical protein M885DRAFT_536234 [Pelagophyceae sp. CCMP2097]|nr:hypothetical protein M885DRAFT_536234 [Pelagophyceae sp. CCMP2097]